MTSVFPMVDTAIVLRMVEDMDVWIELLDMKAPLNIDCLK